MRLYVVIDFTKLLYFTNYGLSKENAMPWLYSILILIALSLFVLFVAGVRMTQLEQVSPPVTTAVDWSGRTRDRRIAITQAIESWKRIALCAFGSNLAFIPLLVLILKNTTFV